MYVDFENRSMTVHHPGSTNPVLEAGRPRSGAIIRFLVRARFPGHTQLSSLLKGPTVLEKKSKVKGLVGLVPSEGCEGESVREPLSWLLGFAGNLWRSLACRCITPPSCSHGFSVCCSLRVCISPSGPPSPMGGVGEPSAQGRPLATWAASFEQPQRRL